MSESILEELSLADPKNANIIVEMADKTRCVSQGIIENVLVKIDKFSFTSDFVIIDTKGLNNKTIILGRPFLANIRAEINISTKEVSLGIKEDMDELSHGADSKTHWCEPVRQEHEKGYTLWASCDPYHEICDGGGIPDKKLKHYWKSTNDDDRISLEWEGLSCINWVRDNKLGGQTQEKTLTKEQEDPEICGETKTRAIIEAMINKLPKEWFVENLKGFGEDDGGGGMMVVRRHESPCASSKFQGMGCPMMGGESDVEWWRCQWEFRYPLVRWMKCRVGDWCVAIDEDDVSVILGCFANGILEVDAMDVDND
ncbi:hypothetical protein Tco_0462007 [Tanacetum coccineum]